MIEELDRVLDHLERLGRATPGLIRPGIALEQLDAFEARLPFLLPEEVRQLYLWRNGTRVEEGDQLDALQFFPGFYFPSLEEAIATFFERQDAPQWEPGWFPVFMDGAGDFYLAVCDKDQRKATTEILGFLHGEPEQIVEYESLDAMTKVLEACYAEGAFFVDDDTLEIDDDLHRAIANRFNPGIEEWQS